MRLNLHKTKNMSPDEYFWSLVDKTKTCWNWIGSLDSGGYGRVVRYGERLRAHRIAYEMKYGAIQNGLFCCHKCDNPKCVRPSHIFLGTQKDNMQDWTRKGLNKAVVNGTLSKRGKDHWKHTAYGKRYVAEWAARMKAEFKAGKRKVMQDEKGRFIGVKVL